MVFPAGSSGYKNNPGFDPGRTVGYVTVDMVAKSIAVHLDEVKQALSNAAAANGEAATVDNGVPVTDGNGTVINSQTTSNTESDTTDLGIKSAAGNEVSTSCPVEWMHKENAYNPPGGIGSGKPSLNEIQTKAMIAELGFFESQWDYKKNVKDNNGDILVGKFLVGAEYLKERGYIKPDALEQYGINTVTNKYIALLS